MEKHINAQGYDLVEVSLDKWILFVNGTDMAFTGTFKKIVRYAVEKLGFKTESFNIAIEEYMKSQDKGHDTIHFGMYGTFIFTFKRPVPSTRKDYTN